ncbi:MAG: SAP domain-containing protein [Clostridiales bacterium]|nr:SAP domain-containing protein [Clostridiales bacterium]
MKGNKGLLIPAGFFAMLSVAEYRAAILGVSAQDPNTFGNLMVGVVSSGLVLLFLLLFVRSKSAPPKKSKRVPTKIRANNTSQEEYQKQEPDKPIEFIHDLLSDSSPDTPEKSDEYDENLDVDIPTPPHAELSYLDSEALRFWNKKRTDFIIPSYYSDTAFGRNVGPALGRLLDGGYLQLGSIEQRIALKTVPELKAILAERELKVSGKKSDLISRIIQNLDEDLIKELFPINIYSLTEKGTQALEPYSIIRENDAHSLGLSYYRLMKEKNLSPDKSNNEIFGKLLDSDIEEYVKTGNRSKYQTAITTAARFFKETGNVKRSFEYFSLSFFVWICTMSEYNLENLDGQTYYLVKNLEQSSKLCSYNIDSFLSVFKETVKRGNPFSLGTPKNIDLAVQIIKKELMLGEKAKL